MTLKDLRLLLRDRGGMFITFIFPLIYTVFLGIVFGARMGGGEAAMRLGVVDEDGSAASAAMIHELKRTAGLSVEPVSREQVDHALAAGELQAAVVIPQGFAGAAAAPHIAGVEVRFLNPPPGEGEVAGDAPRLPWNTGEAGLTSRAWPLPIDPGGGAPRNQYELAFPYGLIWGVLGCTATFGLSFVAERTRGTLIRLQMAPMRRVHVVAGKAGACVLTTVALAAILLAIATIGFDVRPRSFAWLAAGVMSTAVAFSGIMMMLAVLGKTERSAGGLTWTALLGMAMFGGGMVPHFLMPPWMQRIAELSPVRWAILAVESGVWRETASIEAAMTCALLMAIGVVFALIGAGSLRWT